MARPRKLFHVTTNTVRLALQAELDRLDGERDEVMQKMDMLDTMGNFEVDVPVHPLKFKRRRKAKNGKAE